ncbi:MAG: hypothetical protein AAF960_07155 [Bacteroidota bacterium]
MYRLLFLALFLWASCPLFGQKGNFAWGLQAGNHSSRTVLTTEFDNSPLRSDFFIGSTFGVVARQKMGKIKWEWGGFSVRHINLYAEYGLSASYGGYNYRYEDAYTFEEQFTFSAPLLVVFRPTFLKYNRRKFKGKQLYPIVKSGFQFDKLLGTSIDKQYEFGDATLLESVNIDNRWNLSYVGALGFQREWRNGRITYVGINVRTQLGVRTSGTVRLNSSQINEIATFAKQGNIYSIHVQYFFGENARNRDRRAKRYPLPKIIYNPRYY